MKCVNCTKTISKGYKINADVFCSKKCIIRNAFHSVECNRKLSKQEIYMDESARDVQKDCFGEDKE